MASKKATPERITQAECGRRMGIPVVSMTRVWKPKFEERHLPGFYADGMDQAEFAAGWAQILQEEAKATAVKAAAKEGTFGGDDPDTDLKRNRAIKLSMEIQAMRDEMIYIPDLADEVATMSIAFVQAQGMIPRTLAAKLQSWIADLLEDDLKESEAVRTAFGRLKIGILETYLSEKLDESLPDLGIALDKAFRNGITRARLRAS